MTGQEQILWNGFCSFEKITPKKFKHLIELIFLLIQYLLFISSWIVGTLSTVTKDLKM